jgi:hypothetical protein
MVFMHLGDETKNLRALVLVPYFVLIGYLIFICLDEAIYNSYHKSGIENSYKLQNTLPTTPAAHHDGEAAAEGSHENHEGHH